MLEHLYDLLDDADGQAFQLHLAGCPECQAALEKARAQQALLAAARRCRLSTCGSRRRRRKADPGPK